MPRTGRPPLPTAIKKARGETRPSRTNYDEPQIPEAFNLSPPEELPAAAAREWVRVAPLLKESGALKETDLAALEDYCRRLADLRAIEREVEALRELQNSRTPVWNLDPEDMDFKALTSFLRSVDAEERRLLQLQKDVNMLRRELGLTPSSRSQVKVKAPAKHKTPAEMLRDRLLLVKSGQRKR